MRNESETATPDAAASRTDAVKEAIRAVERHTSPHSSVRFIDAEKVLQLAAALAGAERKLAAEQARTREWALALQSLTPGGSEYVDDPPRCVEAAREGREFWRRAAIQFKQEAAAAEKRAEDCIVDDRNAAMTRKLATAKDSLRAITVLRSEDVPVYWRASRIASAALRAIEGIDAPAGEEGVDRFIPPDAPVRTGEPDKCPRHFYEIGGPCICAPPPEPADTQGSEAASNLSASQMTAHGGKIVGALTAQELPSPTRREGRG